MEENSPEPPRAARDYSGLVILGVLAAAEVAIVYVLIAVETPVAPIVRRLAASPLGVVALAIFGVSIISVGMWGFTSWAEWLHKKQNQNDRAA